MAERQTAIKVEINALLEGEYIQKEGWEPNIIKTRRGEISRANIIAIITQELEEGVYLADDGTGQLQLRTFGQQHNTNITVGDCAQIIGRPREYAGALFLNYEIIKKIPKEWLEYRKQELKTSEIIEDNTKKDTETILDDLGEEVIVHSSGDNLFAKILDIIRDLDKENNQQGAEIDTILETASHPEAQHILNSLLEEGEIFEIRPGKIKVLE